MGKIFDAYRLVGSLAKFYDGMLANDGFAAQLALKIFWGLDAAAYKKFLAQAFAGLTADFCGHCLRFLLHGENF